MKTMDLYDVRLLLEQAKEEASARRAEARKAEASARKAKAEAKKAEAYKPRPKSFIRTEKVRMKEEGEKVVPPQRSAEEEAALEAAIKKGEKAFREALSSLNREERALLLALKRGEEKAFWARKTQKALIDITSLAERPATWFESVDRAYWRGYVAGKRLKEVSRRRRYIRRLLGEGWKAIAEIREAGEAGADALGLLEDLQEAMEGLLEEEASLKKKEARLQETRRASKEAQRQAMKGLGVGRLWRHDVRALEGARKALSGHEPLPRLVVEAVAWVMAKKAPAKPAGAIAAKGRGPMAAAFKAAKKAKKTTAKK